MIINKLNKIEQEEIMQNQTPQVNPNKIFVGNLPYTVGEDELRDLFAPHGQIVDLRLIIDRDSGRSKGIGFVEYDSEESAQKAIEALNGHEINERALVVNIARPRQPRQSGGFRRGGGGGGGGGNRRFNNNRGNDRY